MRKVPAAVAEVRANFLSAVEQFDDGLMVVDFVDFERYRHAGRADQIDRDFAHRADSFPFLVKKIRYPTSRGRYCSASAR